MDRRDRRGHPRLTRIPSLDSWDSGSRGRAQLSRPFAREPRRHLSCLVLPGYERSTFPCRIAPGGIALRTPKSRRGPLWWTGRFVWPPVRVLRTPARRERWNVATNGRTSVTRRVPIEIYQQSMRSGDFPVRDDWKGGPTTRPRKATPRPIWWRSPWVDDTTRLNLPGQWGHSSSIRAGGELRALSSPAVVDVVVHVFFVDVADGTTGSVGERWQVRGGDVVADVLG